MHRSRVLLALVRTAPLVLGPTIGVGIASGDYRTPLLVTLAVTPFAFALFYLLGKRG